MNYKLQIIRRRRIRLWRTNYPPEAPPEVDSPQAKDPPLADRLQIFINLEFVIG